MSPMRPERRAALAGLAAAAGWAQASAPAQDLDLQALERSGRLRAAVEELRAREDADPRLLAYLEVQAGEPAAAAARLAALLSERPDDGWALAQLAAVEWRAGELADARVHLRALLDDETRLAAAQRSAEDAQSDLRALEQEISRMRALLPARDRVERMFAAAITAAALLLAAALAVPR